MAAAAEAAAALCRPVASAFRSPESNRPANWTLRSFVRSFACSLLALTLTGQRLSANSHNVGSLKQQQQQLIDGSSYYDGDTMAALNWAQTRLIPKRQSVFVRQKLKQTTFCLHSSLSVCLVSSEELIWRTITKPADSFGRHRKSNCQLSKLKQPLVCR